MVSTAAIPGSLCALYSNSMKSSAYTVFFAMDKFAAGGAEQGVCVFSLSDQRINIIAEACFQGERGIVSHDRVACKK